jgi:serine/threonine protein kinase
VSSNDETQKAPDASLEATRDYAPSSPTRDFPPNLGRFELRAKLGQGSFGAVYRGYDPVLERDVALKVPRREGDEDRWAEAFLREAKAAARLHHPNIVTIFDCGLDGDAPFIAMEFVEGETLAAKMATGCPDFRLSARWVRDLAFALHYAHSHGVVHRDVKPANIMIDRFQRARIMDFGLAKRAPALVESSVIGDSEATRQGMIAGTPAYMAPEQARGDSRAIGPVSDQFSLGVVLYELLTGRRPFDETTIESLLAVIADPQATPKRPCEHRPEIPRELEAIALKALRKNAGERYLTAGDLAVDLDRWLSGIAVEAPLQLDGRGVKQCPECGRHSASVSQCLYCGANLRHAPTRESPLKGPLTPPRVHVTTIAIEKEKLKTNVENLDPETQLKLLLPARDQREPRGASEFFSLPQRMTALLLLAVVVLVGAAYVSSEIRNSILPGSQGGYVDSSVWSEPWTSSPAPDSSGSGFGAVLRQGMAELRRVDNTAKVAILGVCAVVTLWFALRWRYE